ncbi:uncharacterized protein LOC127799966 isoform X2 [Diospyros lotus]|uniref:uncharacterized protein LOC127799966 isoform X2 n=1 Tax=Diospyros lotus TaxID=55363 RepID=UPI002253FDD7|nr:uncharacterized protein LOC127799966 isoform X2 [Diospyros lotus]
MALSGSGGISWDESDDEEWSEELDSIPLMRRREMLLAARRLSGVPEIEFSGGIPETESDGEEWSEELDCIPLMKRREMLLAARRPSSVADIESQKESQNASIPLAAVRVPVKKDNQHSDWERNKSLLLGQSYPVKYAGILGEYNCQGTEVNKHASSYEKKGDEISVNAILAEKEDALSNSLLQCSMMPKYPVKVEVDFADNSSSSLLVDGVEVPLYNNVQAGEIKTEIADDFMDHPDRVVLKDQQRLLLLRNSMALAEPSVEVNCSGSVNPVVSMIQHHLDTDKKENDSADAESSVVRSNRHCVFESSDGQDFMSGNPGSTFSSALPSMSANIKDELLDYCDLHSLDKNGACDFPLNNIISVKSGKESHEDEDKLDHMLLIDRIKMLAMRKDSILHNSNKTESLKETVPPILNCNPIVSESTKPSRVNHPRKRRKTVTDSVEKALEEDAPGLLQALLDKGVFPNEIKLYAETESQEAIDDSTSKDSFSELEAVISKLSSLRQTFLKFAPLRFTKGEKNSYCLACLLSLIEQARYLRFRNWPVDWCWCRDLRSFIFVFERHNRIVLERPEYGYATYFFELVDSPPIDWQIKRLVTAMKLTTCSRSTLIENKTLLIGEHLTDGEARVLMEYGWAPNSGLGTMLNYCDRVFHDQKNEKVSEWKSKIGKLLVDGYNGGVIVSTDIPKKAVEYGGAQDPQIKLEL